MKGKRVNHPFGPRIKKMMQADEDVGKIAQATPVILGSAFPLTWIDEELWQRTVSIIRAIIRAQVVYLDNLI